MATEPWRCGAVFRTSRGPSAEAIERLGLRWRGLAQLLQGKLGAARENLSAVVEPVNPEEHANTVLNYGTNPRSSTQSFLALCDAVKVIEPGRLNAANSRSLTLSN